jgi:hypothetical protein
MTVGAGGAHAGTVAVVTGLPVFLEDKFFHLVTGDAEFFRIGDIHGIVEPDPENAGDHKNNQDQEAK